MSTKSLRKAGLAEDEAYWTALSRGERRSAVARVLQAHDEGRSTLELLEDVCATQDRVGACWQTGEWSIAQEHAATAVSEDVVAALGLRTEIEPTRGLVVVACPAGESHSLPARVVSEVLRLAGWRCQYLGASLPTDQMALLVEDLNPDVVALSCSVPSTLHGLRDMIEAVRESGTPVLVGGRGTGHLGRWALRLGATAWAPDAVAATAALDRPDWPQFVSPVPKLRPADTEGEKVLAGVDVAAAEAMIRLQQRFSAMEQYSPRQVRSTHEDLRHIVRFLSAALLVDDLALFTDFLGWLDDVLAARGVPRRALALGLESLDVPGPRAVRFLQGGRDFLAAR